MKKEALIFGGGGIGTEIAKELLKREPDKRIVVAGRDKPDLDCEGGQIRFVPMNFAVDSLDCLEELDLDTLVVTAGIGRLNFFETFTAKEVEQNFRVNAMAAIRVIQMFYDRINSDEPFHTAVVTSIAGHVASPLYGAYSASKGALVKFIEAVNGELGYRGRSNRILDVAPGYVGGTGFHGGARSHSQQEELESLAGSVVDAMERGEELLIPHYEVYAGVLQRYHADASRFARESIAYKLEKNQLQDRAPIKTGYLTGTFDLFHVGHLNLLRRAKQYCDRLVVGVHPDAKHKNKEVFVPLEDRIEILKGVRYVDEVMVCGNEDTDAYETVKYDYLFVGSDYQGTERFQRYEEFFAEKGVKIIYLPYTTKTSSTQLREAISQAAQKASE